MLTEKTKCGGGVAETFASDVPLDLAISAHAGTSFAPEQRGEYERRSYAETLASDYADLFRHATTDEKRATLESEFARYHEGYRRRFLRLLASRARCVSPMIAGPSKFPFAQAQKRGRVTDARMNDLCSYREHMLKSIKRALHPELAPIMGGDSDALERLRAKLATHEKVQQKMKAANAQIRANAKSGPDAQIAALLALGYDETTARKILTPDFASRVGFPDYAIRNNGTEIRRLKARLAQVETTQATPATTMQGSTARVEDVPAENRVRLFFPGKPTEDVRERLKRAGFRWAPSLSCWQAYRNTSTIEIAHREAAGGREAA